VCGVSGGVTPAVTDSRERGEELAGGGDDMRGPHVGEGERDPGVPVWEMSRWAAGRI
jgi:hypothetical protein